MTITVKFKINSLSGQPQLFPGTDTFEQSVKYALEAAIDNKDEEALQWLSDNVYEIK